MLDLKRLMFDIIGLMMLAEGKADRFVARLLRVLALGLVHFKYEESHYLQVEVQKAMRSQRKRFRFR